MKINLKRQSKRFFFSSFKQNLYRPWDYPENFGICSQLDRKSKTCFFTFLNVYIFWIERDKILISQLSPPKFRYFADQNGSKGGTPWKWILTIFKWKNEFPKQLGLEKQMKKMGSFVWFSCLLPELWSLNCQKLCPFCIFLLMSATNLRLL